MDQGYVVRPRNMMSTLLSMCNPIVQKWFNNFPKMCMLVTMVLSKSHLLYQMMMLFCLMYSNWHD